MAGSSEEPESPDGGEEKRIKTGRRRRPVVGSPFNWLYTPSTWFLVIQPLAGTAHIYLTVKSTLNYLSKALVSKINVMMYGTLLASIHMSRTQSSHVDQRTTWIYQCRNQSFSLHVQIRAAILEDETLKLFLSNKRHFTLALEGLRLTISIICALNLLLFFFIKTKFLKISVMKTQDIQSRDSCCLIVLFLLTRFDSICSF